MFSFASGALLLFVPFIIMLGVLVFVHEFGHFITAKLFKVKVLVFAFGFGPWLVHKKIGETEYGIKPLPLGGYVKLFGDPSEADELDEKELAEEDKERALFAQAAWKKLVIFAAGSIMNIALAFAIAPVIYWIGIQRSYLEVAKPNVGTILPDSPAANAGIKPGDLVVAINGKKIPTFQDLITTEMLNPGRLMDYTVQRGGSVLNFQIRLDETKDEKAGSSGIYLPGMEPLIGLVKKGSPAEKAGLKPDDKILSIDGEPVHYWHEMTGIIQASQGRAVKFEVERGGTKLILEAIPEYNAAEKRYLIGIEQKQQTVFVKYGFAEGLRQGWRRAFYWSGLTVRIVGKLFSGQVSPKTMSGPLGIAVLAGEAWRLGLSRFIDLLVIISVNLGILNLIPIPPLDGAHLLITALEAISRRRVPKRLKEAIFTFFFFLLIGFIIWVTFNDLQRMVPSLPEWFHRLQERMR